MKEDYIKCRQRGVTLVEVVISLLLLSIATGALIGAFVISKLSATRARHRISAINLVREKIETIKGVLYDQIPAQAGNPEIIIDQGSADSGDELRGHLITDVLDIYGNGSAYKITTTVVWMELSSSLQEKVITLISRH
jgi:prepilin-type N-terminal cleavage/methylation domain-containing protein